MTAGAALPALPVGRVHLGESEAGTPILGYGFAGCGEDRVLVIAGVHGSERSGVEVAERLAGLLQTGYRPVPHTVVVPALFPDNVAQGLRQGEVPTNRNFPRPGESLEGARRRGRGTPVDSLGLALLPENVILVDLVERFRPVTLISVHATVYPERAGIFADPHTVPPGVPGDVADRLAEAVRRDTERDAALALRLARAAAARGVSLAGNRLEAEPTVLWSGETPEGTSLGGWAPCAVADGGPGGRPAVGVITVEVNGLPASAEAADPVLRRAELTALAETILDEALGATSPD
ncbi:MAG: hypothetical protein GVY13_13665 [Alphaproteobacteria bacterium]|jgi:hypothetical protein|nr:hypothetical protein [Alphaproteobacteria bacterium]